MPHAAAFHHHPHAGFYPRPPPKPRVRPNVGKFYHPRDHAASPFFRIVRDHFAEFEKVYPERFRHIYGFWRPVIRSSIEKFLKCGDLIHWHAHIHAIVPEGVFTSSGHFVHIPDIWQYRAVEIWQEHVFDLLLDECKITLEVAASMRAWKHSGFGVDTSVKIAGGDNTGMQHLVEYIARCPFSLARMIDHAVALSSLLCAGSILSNGDAMKELILSKVKACVAVLEPSASVYLFGSRTRNDFTTTSDWDFLVLVDDEVTVARADRIRHALYEIEWETGEVISTVVKSRQVWDDPGYRVVPLHQSVEREGILL